jgi:hypothetical protein
MKGGLYCRTASFFMIMLTYCLLCSFSLTEARDLRTEVIHRQGIGLEISSRESNPYEDITHEEKVGGLTLYPIAETNIQSFRKSSEKVDVEIFVRSMKEAVIAPVSAMDHSPGIGHNSPPASLH